MMSSPDCFDFPRSLPMCEKNRAPGSTREHFNEISAFVDASNVYGYNIPYHLSLREEGTPYMRVSNGDNAPLLPELNVSHSLAGDVRSSENPALASMHTLFVREHNRVAKGLMDADGGETDVAKIFQMARMIVIAEWQSVVFDEYLPILLGSKTAEELELTTKIYDNPYDASVNPSIRNEFSTAAFRFGHTMVEGMHRKVDAATAQQMTPFTLSKNFFHLTEYMKGEGKGMDQILKGQMDQPSQVRTRQFGGECGVVKTQGVATHAKV